MTKLSFENVDQNFINTLFEHPTFQARLEQATNSGRERFKGKPWYSDSEQLSQVIEEIASLLCQKQEYSLSAVYQQLKKQIADSYLQIDKIRQSNSLQNSRVDCTSPLLAQDPLLADEHFYDLPSIKRTIIDLQEKVKQISLNSSALLDSTQPSKHRDDLVQEKISQSIGFMESSCQSRQELFEQSVSKKIQKQQKTINNILDTLNDFPGQALSEKKPNNSTTSLGGTKFKSFFGFK